jgi:hypothetical protein
MKRRSFLAGMLAAPAIVRAESLMKIVVPKQDVWGASFAEMIYDINMQATIQLRPTKIIVPDYLREQCLQILNAEFDKGYTAMHRKM